MPLSDDTRAVVAFAALLTDPAEATTSISTTVLARTLGNAPTVLRTGFGELWGLAERVAAQGIAILGAQLIALFQATHAVATPAAVDGTPKGGLATTTNAVATGRHAVLRAGRCALNQAAANTVAANGAVRGTAVCGLPAIAHSIAASGEAILGTSPWVVDGVGQSVLSGLAVHVAARSRAIFKAADMVFTGGALAIPAAFAVDVADIGTFAPFAFAVAADRGAILGTPLVDVLGATADLVATSATVDGATARVLTELTDAIATDREAKGVHGPWDADPVHTGVIQGAQVTVKTDLPRQGLMVATAVGNATVGRAGIPIVAIDTTASDTVAVDALVIEGTRIGIIALAALVGRTVLTSRQGVARIGGADRAIVTIQGLLPGGTEPRLTHVPHGARIQIVAGALHGLMDTPAGRLAPIRGANVVIVALHLVLELTHAVEADIDGAGIAIVAGPTETVVPLGQRTTRDLGTLATHEAAILALPLGTRCGLGAHSAHAPTSIVAAGTPDTIRLAQIRGPIHGPFVDLKDRLGLEVPRGPRFGRGDTACDQSKDNRKTDPSYHHCTPSITPRWHKGRR